MPLSMGKGLGGASSINALMWTRGHRSDWDYFAKAAGDDAWNYDATLKTYRRIEDWQGAPDPHRPTGTPGRALYIEHRRTNRCQPINSGS
jgi:choline dehydrogenase|uniref:GMC family oxidoreductase N-terminal domain-containing protein n=1 Tax=uncultured Sphingomonas sp. TaxID=158754 RepID=UPI0035CAF7FE